MLAAVYFHREVVRIFGVRKCKLWLSGLLVGHGHVVDCVERLRVVFAEYSAAQIEGLLKVGNRRLRVASLDGRNCQP